MKTDLFDIKGNKIGTVELPIQFNEEFRPDLIKRAALVAQANKRQSYGTYFMAGQRASAEISKRRHSFKTSYGKGISRTPKKTIWRRGSQFGWVGAFAPNTVGGRKAHPPKSSKIFAKKINITERRKAIRSALAATTIKNLVLAHGHIITTTVPLIIESKLESLNKTKDLIEVLEKLGLKKELERISLKKIRAGKGKTRGRKYKTKKGPLIVISKKCPLKDSASNLLGVETCLVNNLNADLLAPGTIPGRLTIFTQAALDKLKEQKLFLDTKQVLKTQKKVKKNERSL